ncbi:hypothetical protein LJR267_010710 [Paraburkholderia hospita]|uniref:hypothetical protein n=1 Tax=Paraburkholderia hospita TaxID=169430 RepID=UPI003ECE6B9E
MVTGDELGREYFGAGDPLWQTLDPATWDQLLGVTLEAIGQSHPHDVTRAGAS